MLPAEKRTVYRRLQETHIHGSPDGPWFFLVAQTADRGSNPRRASLLGITDTSMLRPQVFALQEGGADSPTVGMAASEKQAIDAAMASLSREHPAIDPRADQYWNASAVSHTDGGALLFHVDRDGNGQAKLVCTDKFGRPIGAEDLSPPGTLRGRPVTLSWERSGSRRAILTSSLGLATATTPILKVMHSVGVRRPVGPISTRAVYVLALLMDRRFSAGCGAGPCSGSSTRPSERWAEAILDRPPAGLAGGELGSHARSPTEDQASS
jgi:hypothetical protein